MGIFWKVVLVKFAYNESALIKELVYNILALLTINQKRNVPRIFWSRVYIFNYIASVCRKDLGNALTTPLLVTLSLCVAKVIWPEHYKHWRYTLAYVMFIGLLNNKDSDNWRLTDQYLTMQNIDGVPIG